MTDVEKSSLETSSRTRLLWLLPLVLLFLALGWIGGGGFAPDVAVIDRLAAWRHASPGLTSAVIAITWLGSAYVTLGASAVVVAWLLWRRHKQTALMLFATLAIERLLGDGIKLLYDRARPAVDLHPVATNSSSYPSGHAANSMTAFVALALLAAPARYRGPALAVAIPIAILVGLSRPFLGVHWLSDTFGGWTLAAMVLLTLSLFAPRALAADEAQHEVVGRHPDPAIEG